jgi:serine/threonine protein kinase
MVGKRINNYRIISKIGEGGMGIVYLAKHDALPDRKAAINILNPEFTDDEDLKQRFFDEAVVLSSLNHDNIVTLYDFIAEDNYFYLIMEYIEGKGLDEIIKNNYRGLTENRCLNIFLQILDAFSFAHSRGIIHGDIKPSNIIVQADDTPKILDFGIAKVLQTSMYLTRTGKKIGSLLYMSPEQILGKTIDVRSDIYSLGILLYEMLTGYYPYDTDTNSDYMIQNAIVNEPMIPPLEKNKNISKTLNEVILKAVDKNPDNRFNTCREFLLALENKISGERIIESEPADLTNLPFLENNNNFIENPVTGYICNFCESEIELERDEIESGRFICPACGKMNKIQSSEYICKYCNSEIELDESETESGRFNCPA